MRLARAVSLMEHLGCASRMNRRVAQRQITVTGSFLLGCAIARATARELP
jgi:hypothetical protein